MPSHAELMQYLALVSTFLVAANPVVHNILLPAAKYFQEKALLTSVKADDKVAIFLVNVLEVTGAVLDAVGRYMPHVTVVGKPPASAK